LTQHFAGSLWVHLSVREFSCFLLFAAFFVSLQGEATRECSKRRFIVAVLSSITLLMEDNFQNPSSSLAAGNTSS
jgi:hypothetical protein